MILISVGYPHDRQHGANNGDGGERRLNVLFTRARVRCEVISLSILPRSIVPRVTRETLNSPSPGVWNRKSVRGRSRGMKSIRRLVAQGFESISAYGNVTGLAGIFSPWSVTERATTVRSGRANGIDCGRMSWNGSAGDSIAYGARTGSIDANKKSSGCGSR